MHDSEKAQKKRKNAKYIVDLSTCFNVSVQVVFFNTFTKNK